MMNAVEMLKRQHREVEKLFVEFEDAESPEARRDTFDEIADALAVHAAIEEKHFYPTVKQQETEDILVESVEEHLEVKRGIAELLAMDADDDDFSVKVNELREDVEQHVEEEEGELFPKVERLFDKVALERLGAVMEDLQGELLRRGNPRDAIPDETGAPAPL
jgi:hemerythrin superfamily protein